MNEFLNEVYFFLLGHSGHIMFVGYLLLTVGMGVYSFKSKSSLLKVSAAGFFVSAFATGSSIAFPMSWDIQPGVGAFFYPGLRPEWVVVLGSVGFPIANLVSGVSLSLFALRKNPAS